MRRDRLLSAYSKLRSGKSFLIVLSVFCGVWIGWNMVPGLPPFDDSSFGRLTLILSVEASLATSMLMVANERQEEAERNRLKYIQHLLEAQMQTMKLIEQYINTEPHNGVSILDDRASDQAKNPSLGVRN